MEKPVLQVNNPNPDLSRATVEEDNGPSIKPEVIIPAKEEPKEQKSPNEPKYAGLVIDVPVLKEEKTRSVVENTEKVNAPEDQMFEGGLNDLKNLREKVSRMKAQNANFDTESGESLKSLEEKYLDQKNKVANNIRTKLREQEVFGPLTPEQQKELNSKINDEIFSRLIKEENDLYNENLRANRKKTWKDDLKIEGAKLLSSKAVKWYLSLSKNERRAFNFTLGSLVGVVAGAAASAGVVSYLGWRAARFGASAFAGTAAGEWANKKWSVDDLNKAEEKKLMI